MVMEEVFGSRSMRILQRRTNLVAKQGTIAVVHEVEVPVAVRLGVVQKESVIDVKSQDNS